MTRCHKCAKKVPVEDAHEDGFDGVDFLFACRFCCTTDGCASPHPRHDLVDVDPFTVDL